jgi:protocatechuate 3,4-dioxygenase beta subunit
LLPAGDHGHRRSRPLQFQTVKPGHYGGPAHIHFQVRDQHGREVTTELLRG